MPAASSTRSPKALTSRPTNGAITSRISANALTTAPAAALPTPNSRANSGSAGATRPKPSATMKATPVSARTSGGRSRKSTHYSTGRPSPRAISIRCTSEVPSPISSTFASR